MKARYNWHGIDLALNAASSYLGEAMKHRRHGKRMNALSDLAQAKDAIIAAERLLLTPTVADPLVAHERNG